MTTNDDIDVRELALEAEGEQDAERRSRWVPYIVAFLVLALIVWFLLAFVRIVPSTVGTTRGRSAVLIRNSGFRSEVTTVPAGLRFPGRVIEQQPPYGLYFTFWPVKVTATAGIGLRVSGVLGGHTTDDGNYDIPLGESATNEVLPVDQEEMDPLIVPTIPAERLMPNVQNMTEAKAKAAISKAGLSLAISRGPSTTDVAGGRVYYQDPPPGTRVALAQRATLWISTQPFDSATGDGFPYPRPVGP